MDLPIDCILSFLFPAETDVLDPVLSQATDVVVVNFVVVLKFPNSDFDFCIAEHNELPVIEICSDEGRDDCQQLKPKGTEASFETTVITATILVIISILFNRVTVNVLVFVLRVVFFPSKCVYCDVVHVRCCASGLCIISKFCVRVF